VRQTLPWYRRGWEAGIGRDDCHGEKPAGKERDACCLIGSNYRDGCGQRCIRIDTRSVRFRYQTNLNVHTFDFHYLKKEVPDSLCLPQRDVTGILRSLQIRSYNNNGLLCIHDYVMHHASEKEVVKAALRLGSHPDE